MVILGLDASSIACGWCLLDGDMYVDSDIKVWHGHDWWTRVSRFQTWLESDMVANHHIDVVGYEIARGDHGNMRTNRILGAVEYVARRSAANSGARFVQLSPGQIKATGCHKNALRIAEGIVRQNKPDFSFSLETEKERALAGDHADGIGAAYATALILTKERIHEQYYGHRNTAK